MVTEIFKFFLNSQFPLA